MRRGPFHPARAPARAPSTHERRFPLYTPPLSFALRLLAVLALAPAAAAAQLRTTHQVIAELQLNANALRTDSRLNPGNAAGLQALDPHLRIFPAAELSTGPVKLRADLGVALDRTEERGLRGSAEVQELYTGVTLSERAYLVVGRQRLGWGTGFVWNPTRLDAAKDPLRVANRLKGLDAVRVEYAAPAATVNVLVGASEGDHRYLYAARVEKTFGPLSTSVSAVNPGRGDWRAGYDWSYASDRWTLYGEGTVQGASARPRVDSAGARVEPGRAGGVSGLYHDVVAGSLLSVSPRVTAVAEYRFRNDYYTGAQNDRFVRSLPRNGDLYDPTGMGRGRIFGMLRYADAERGFGVSLRGFADPTTGQLMFGPGTERSGRNLKLEVTPLVFYDPGHVSPHRAQVQVVLSSFF